MKKLQDDLASYGLGDALVALLVRFQQGQLSAEMTLMYWLMLGHKVEEVEVCLGALEKAAMVGLSTAEPSFLSLHTMLAVNREGCQRIADMLASGVDSDRSATSVEEGIAFCRRLFDWSVQQSPEASVALYSLGNPVLLTAATQEIVAWLRGQDLLGQERDALDIGCGIGRFEEALSPVMRTITGIDVSPAMVKEAQRRCEKLTNVRVLECEGRDLARFADASFDLVLAVDSFPYLFRSGWPLLARHFQESARVLRPGGRLAVLDLSYGRTVELDRADFARLAQEAALQVIEPGAQPFEHWDGWAFLACKTRSTATEAIEMSNCW
ncbi:MAG: methylase involved in ubiquinone/menaquinone biosynthesis [Variovorax sp.]|nr:methylase involved in ubiquinone/menaquinone biosynthesis [Variovorax sp.]